MFFSALSLLTWLLEAIATCIATVPFLFAAWVCWVLYQDAKHRRQLGAMSLCPRCRVVYQGRPALCPRGHSTLTTVYRYNAAQDAPLSVVEHNPYVTQPMSAILGEGGER